MVSSNFQLIGMTNKTDYDRIQSVLLPPVAINAATMSDDYWHAR